MCHAEITVVEMKISNAKSKYIIAIDQFALHYFFILLRFIATN